MELRFRFIVLALVGLVAVAVWTFPAWRLYFRDRGGDAPFPGLELELQDDFLALPRARRERLLEEYERDAAVALEMALAAIDVDRPAPPDDIADQLEGARALFSGEFQELNALHWGAGRATIYELADGRRILRFADFASALCREVRVYLARDPQPLSALQLEGALDLGRLKGNIGDQYYFLPADHDLSVYESAVVYCQQFETVLTAARLR